MKITFDTNNAEEVLEVAALLQNMKITIGTEKKEVVKPTETVVEAPKKEKATPSIPKPKKTVAAPVEKTISLAEIKELAKLKVGATDRETVKTIISEFAEKLAEVKEADYAALAEKLA